MTGRMLTESGEVVNIAELMAYIAGGAGDVKPTNYLYVGKNGNDSTGDGSANLPYLTISQAITVASSGTTIFIWPGTYAESITFKAGVNITSPVAYGVYITGNHTASFSGTVICENIVLQNASSAASGTTLAISGSTALNLQFYNSYINSNSTSGAGDAINWTNTNSSSKLQIIDGNVTVTVSGSTARAFYSTTGAAGSVIANRATFKLANSYDNVCLNIGGAINFTHTQDAVYGQMVVANTASLTSAIVSHTCATVPVLSTTSTGTTIFLECIDTTTSSPAVTGTGVFTFSATTFGSTGIGGSSTLNSGYGPLPLAMSPIRLRNASALLPSTAVAAGLLDGTFELVGTKVYITIGTTRYYFNLTAA